MPALQALVCHLQQVCIMCIGSVSVLIIVQTAVVIALGSTVACQDGILHLTAAI